MLSHLLFGKLTLDAIPLHNPIVMPVIIMMILGALAVTGALFYFKKWGVFWRDWVTTVDHKRIGVMYLVLAGIMLLRGFADALMMRSQQAIAAGDQMGYLPPEHYDQIFTAHGVIMIFFMAMPMMFGLVNLVLPLQIGARDVAYPYLNSLSFWMTAIGAVLVMISLAIGKFSDTGWLAYPPLSGLVYSPGVGVDYYIWALQISGAGSLLSGINFIVTILKMRAKGMTLMKMPIFTWSVLCAMILVALAFPVLTATLGMLSLDRFFDMHFFTGGFGGNAMMYINLIWAWGHPEVYILILPAFGIFSEVVPTFSKKRLFGYTSMVYATAVITLLSFIVWLHHFFTMGAGANVNAFFGITTMIIAIPTGLKIFNWLFTMYQGRVQFTESMLWAIAFISTFAVGGMTGVIMSVPTVDFQLHNSVFLVAHFHNVIIGGVVFGYFSGIVYWFPKIFGFTLNERLGKYSFVCWVVGFYIAFMPLYVLGLKGMTRRINHYSTESGYQPWLIVAAIGSLIIGLGIALKVLQLLVSIKDRKKNQDYTGDPWDGRTLEWSIPSPAPFYNFATDPVVEARDDFWVKKQAGTAYPEISPEAYKPIHMPKNTATGFVASLFAGAFGFAMVWHIMWMIAFGLIGLIVVIAHRTFQKDVDYYIQPEALADYAKAYRERAALAAPSAPLTSQEEN
jgi:cytochrome o ubiquinol oxidase subunit 1